MTASCPSVYDNPHPVIEARSNLGLDPTNCCNKRIGAELLDGLYAWQTNLPAPALLHENRTSFSLDWIASAWSASQDFIRRPLAREHPVAVDLRAVRQGVPDGFDAGRHR